MSDWGSEDVRGRLANVQVTVRRGGVPDAEGTCVCYWMQLDLYQIHRRDPDTPMEETLWALDSLVKAGKVLYLGASSMFAWQF
jgi:hypothetical protein